MYASYSDTLHNVGHRYNGLSVIMTKPSLCMGNASVIKNAACVICSLVANDINAGNMPGHLNAIKILVDCRGAGVPLIVGRLNNIEKIVMSVANLVRSSVQNVQLFADADYSRKLRKGAAF